MYKLLLCILRYAFCIFVGGMNKATTEQRWSLTTNQRTSWMWQNDDITSLFTV